MRPDDLAALRKHLVSDGRHAWVRDLDDLAKNAEQADRYKAARDEARTALYECAVRETDLFEEVQRLRTREAHLSQTASEYLTALERACEHTVVLASCIKCGSPDINTTWHAGHGRYGTGGCGWDARVVVYVEHLHRTCRNCRYEWADEPLDAPASEGEPA